MNDNERQKIALFRYGIIAPAVSGTYDESLSLKGFFRDASKKVYTNPRGEDTMISAATIERWYYAYMDSGFDALLPKRRTDTGKSRKLDSDITEQINFLKTEYPRIPATLIHQKLIENGTIKKGTVSLSTINRYVNRLNEEKGLFPQKDMRRYEREHINEVWCGDSSVGPYITINGQKKRTYVIALIDDASRMIVGINIFFNDNFVNLMSVMKTAVIRFGRPKKLNFDNGSTYKNKQIDLLAARIGSVINYNPPYTPVGKAKIERWFRTMKDHWMSQLDMIDISSMICSPHSTSFKKNSPVLTNSLFHSFLFLYSPSLLIAASNTNSPIFSTTTSSSILNTFLCLCSTTTHTVLPQNQAISIFHMYHLHYKSHVQSLLIAYSLS